MIEDEIKLSQNQKDIDRLNEESAEIQARIDAAKEPKWIAAVSDKAYGGRLVLNLAALSSPTKAMLKDSIKRGDSWISFGRKGYSGNFSAKVTGLTDYPDTKIVFP